MKTLNEKLKELYFKVDLTEEQTEIIRQTVMSHMASLAGQKTSDLKAQKARENGNKPAGKGKVKGRPKGSKNKVKSK